MDLADFTSSGSVFHMVGAKLQKALSPKVTNLDLGTCNNCFDCDRSCLDGVYSCKREERYRGAEPCKHLKTVRNTLYSILHFTGSQCSSFRTGVMWSYFLSKRSLEANLWWGFFEIHKEGALFIQRLKFNKMNLQRQC